MGVAKIAISVPTEVLARVEEARRSMGQSRSQFVVTAVEDYLRRRSAEEEAEAYRRGYELFPETEEEGAFAQLGAAFLGTVPWNETG